MAGTFYDYLQWTERGVAGAGHWVGGELSDLWDVNVRVARWLGSEVAQGGRWVYEVGDERIARMVPGHYYDSGPIPLGVYHRVSPAMLLDAIRHNPGSFPIRGDKPFEVGATVTLWFVGTPNPVIVEKVDTSDPNRASMLLRALPDHFFGGTAEHIIVRQPGDRLAYQVIGHGPTQELKDRNWINYQFGMEGWKRLAPLSVVPLAKKLEGQ